MTDHDDAAGERLSASPYEPTGQRRATFKPPPPSVPADTAAQALGGNDDELALAIEAEMARALHASTIPATPLTAASVADGAASEGPITVTPGVPEMDTAVEIATADEAEVDVDDDPVVRRPTRRSLSDDVLLRTLETEAAASTDTLARIDQLEQQLTLREEEARQFAQWEETMRGIGTPDALAELEGARQEFTDLIPVVASGPAIAGTEREAVPPPALIEPDEPTPTPPVATLDFNALLTGPPIADDMEDASRVRESQQSASPAEPEPLAQPHSPELPEPPAQPQSPEIPESIAGLTAISVAVAAVAPAEAPRAWQVEAAGLEPTPLDQRVGRAARLFWLWFAANSSVVSIAFGAGILALGMSLRQAIVATLAGVAISFLPLGLGTLAGKWSGQPTMVVSRATFGLVGNALPAALALLTRLFWGAVLLWVLSIGTARILVPGGVGSALEEARLQGAIVVAGLLLAVVVAFFGYGLIARAQLVLSVASGILVAGFIVATWPRISISKALTVGDGPWILVVTGAVLVFSFIGLVWAVSGADLARYQRPGSSGAASMLWSSFGTTLPAFLLIAYGALLAASSPDVAAGLVETPVDTMGELLPPWYPVPLIAAVALSLLSGVVVSIYSAGFALQSLAKTLRRQASTLVVGAALGVLAVLIVFMVGDFTVLLRDLATTLAVPIAAWAGIFSAETMIRSRRFDAGSLLRRGGVYPDVNWVNLGMLVAASAVGFGFTSAAIGWLDWQGYLFLLLGVPLSTDLAGSDVGVFVALLIGILTPIVAGIPAVRRQERAVSPYEKSA